ncbi:MAG: trypsin-like peptidase domain-containing protein [Planctomycetaceae bacterium]|nr:trypsin-like peptidase domain-containing protein [Planctomycetaceae bacterium]
MITSAIPAAILSMAALSGQPRGEVLDFSSTSCPPCQRMAPIVSRLERAGYPIRNVDVNANRALADRFGITNIPTFVLVVDGREVRRVVGAVAESELLDMLGQIPVDPPVTTPAQESRPRSQPQRTAAAEATPQTPVTSDTPGRPGESTPPSRTLPVAVFQDEPSRTTQPASKLQDGPTPSLFDKLLGRGRQASAPTSPEVVRGNVGDDVPAPTGGLPVRNPAEASVRLQVTINGQTQLGSGTAVDSRPGQTLILSCGHLFDGWNSQSKIEVDLFLGGEVQRFVGRMIHYDLSADVGLIGIPTDHIVPTAEIAPTTRRPQSGEDVVSIGCSGGAVPSYEQLQITALNYYEGPDNIECTGVPVQGRSGGGLFNRQGQLIGVCIAADADRQRGAYAGLLAIHDLLLASGMTDLYQTTPATEAVPASPGEASSATAAQVASAGESPDSIPWDGSSHAEQNEPRSLNVIPPPQTRLESFEGSIRNAAATSDSTGATEVICIIRSREQPQAPSRVVIIDRPSSRFLSYLDGEVAAHETPVRANRIPSPASPPRPLSQTEAGAPRFSTPAVDESSESTSGPGELSRSAHLQPTSLARPVRPQRYIRSLHSQVPR